MGPGHEPGAPSIPGARDTWEGLGQVTLSSCAPTVFAEHSRQIAATGLTAYQAIDTTWQVVPGGAVVDIDQGWERGRSYWDVVVRAPDGGAVEIYLGAATGVVLEQSQTRTTQVNAFLLRTALQPSVC